MAKTLECWCFFFCCIAVVGGGLMLSNSLSAILTAAGNPSSDANILAETLYSTGNMLGRLTCMLPSDLVVRRGFPRPLMIVLILMGMATSHGLFLILPTTDGSEVLIAPAAFIGGYSFGSMWPHMVIITSEVFGTKFLPDNYMLYDGGSTFLGSIVLSRILAGSVQEAHTLPGSKTCLGAGCFQITHVVVLALNLLGIIAALVMVRKSAPVYRHIHQSLCAAARGAAGEDHSEPLSVHDSFTEFADGKAEQPATIRIVT